MSENAERAYPDPVDPWATGEAAALEAGGHGLYSAPRVPAQRDRRDAPPPDDPREPRVLSLPRRRTPYVIGLVVLLVLTGSGVGWALWPKDLALDYVALKELDRVQPVVPITSSWSDAEVFGDRVYFASSGDAADGADQDSVGVTAVDVGQQKPAWSSTQAGTATRWESMTALPVGVVLLSDTDSATRERTLAVLDVQDGHLRWKTTIGDDDEMFYAGGYAVRVDKDGHRMVGLRLGDGGREWTLPDPAGSTSTTTIAATTPGDLDGSATLQGRPLRPDLTDDTTLVQVGSDRSARVVDATNGKVRAKRTGVADTGDEVIAHNGRLIVRESHEGQRIVTYGLGKLDDPKILYTAQTEDGELGHVTACGDNRVCLVERNGYDAKTSQVVSIDAAKGVTWRYPMPGADALVPVGTSLLASADDGTTLIDERGQQSGRTKGVAVRLDAGNVLEFSKELAGYPDDPSLAGQHVGDEAVQLGPLTDVRTKTCSWNRSVIACVADKDFVIARFTK